MIEDLTSPEYDSVLEDIIYLNTTDEITLKGKVFRIFQVWKILTVFPSRILLLPAGQCYLRSEKDR